MEDLKKKKKKRKVPSTVATVAVDPQMQLNSDLASNSSTELFSYMHLFLTVYRRRRCSLKAFRDLAIIGATPSK